jgi:FMN reductase
MDTPGARDGGRATRVAVLSGSPAPGSRTWSLAAEVGERLSARELEVELIDLRALPPAEVLLGPGGAGPVRAALDAVARADGVVVATPVHHSAYSGLLKAFLDLLPRSALSGKVVLPMAVGGSAAHVLTLDYALRPVLVSLGAVHVTRGQVVLHDEIGRAPDGAIRIHCEAELRLEGVLREFALCLRLHAHGGAAFPLAPSLVPVLAGDP